MSLADLQTALGTMVVTRGSAARLEPGLLDSFGGLNLTAEERAWLNQVAHSPGFEVTCKIQRWWRELRLRQTLPLTLALLEPEKCAELLNAYLDTHPSLSLFYIPEALGFLDFVTQTAPAVAHLGAIAKFERAMLLATEDAAAPSSQTSEAAELLPAQRITRHPAASIVGFSAPPAALLGALLFDQPLPAPQEQIFPVLVAPGLPRLWRPATPDEALLFACCQPSATVELLLATVDGNARLLETLLSAGALCATNRRGSARLPRPGVKTHRQLRRATVQIGLLAE